MKFKKYQKQIGKVADYTPIQPKGLIPLLWLSEETGEVVKCFKHSLKDRETIDYDDVMEEMGDVLTTLANLANECDLDLNEIAKNSIDKLSKRTGKDPDKSEDDE